MNSNAIKKSLTVFFVAVCAVAASVQSPAQTKQETKLYKKTMKAPSRASYKKFLEKMPQSYYADEIRARLDTLLNISPYSIEDAHAIAKDVLVSPEGRMLAGARRQDGKDRIVALIIGEKATLRFATLEQAGTGWNIIFDYTEDSGYGESCRPVLVDDEEYVETEGKKMLRCGVLLRTEDSMEGEMVYSAWLLDAFSEKFVRLDFLGTDILKKGESLPFKIEGRVNEIAYDGKSKEAEWLKGFILNDSRFVELPFGVIQSDEAIRWWRKENGETATKGGTLKFCSLPEGCSLIEEFAKAKYRSRSAKYVAALFDCRGWTVIVSQNRETGAYNLAWAEPECKDHARDVLLNDITFRSATSLEMQYFHGKRFYKRTLNLASMTLR